MIGSSDDRDWFVLFHMGDDDDPRVDGKLGNDTSELDLIESIDRIWSKLLVILC